MEEAQQFAEKWKKKLLEEHFEGIKIEEESLKQLEIEEYNIDTVE